MTAGLLPLHFLAELLGGGLRLVSDRKRVTAVGAVAACLDEQVSAVHRRVDSPRHREQGQKALASEANLTALADMSGRWIAAFALPDLYEFLEAEGYKYVIRLKANSVLQQRIAHLLKRPAGRPPNHVQRFHASFTYQAGSWSRKRRVVAKVEWHPGELYPRVGFLVTNLTRPANRVVAFYNQRGTAEQRIKEGKNAVRWTRLSCHAMKANAVRLQLHALAYNLASFLRTLALADEMACWSLTAIREKVVKIGAKVIAHARYTILQMAEGRCRAICSTAC